MDMRTPRLFLFDLDGTVYCGTEEVPGAVSFIRTAMLRGIRCLYVTNRSTRSAEAVRDQLRGFGIPCETEDVLTTATATARFLGGGSAYVVGEAGLHEALREQGIRETDEHPDAVVVSIDREITYAKIATASRLIRDEGVRFIVTNTDVCLKLENGLNPGSGAIVAAVATAARRLPDVVIGKPSPILYEQALARSGVAASEAVAIGDNLLTDIAAGVTAGIRTALVLTGISKREEVTPEGPQPTWIAETFEELERMVM